MSKRKLLRRAWVVFQNALNSLLQPFLNIAVSLAVVRLASEQLWGAFVGIMVVVQLAAHIAGWGNREYLLREFSRHPDQIAVGWGRSLGTRLALYALLALVVYVLHGGLAALWGLALVLAAAFDVLVVYRKAFGFALLIEVVSALLLVGVVLGLQESLTIAHLLIAFTLVHLGKFAAYSVRFRRIWRGLDLRFDPAYLRLAFPFFLLGFSGILATRIDLYAVSYYLPDESVARYQVFINLMIYLQAISNFVVLPYVKSLYRLDDAVMTRLAGMLFGLGCLLLPPALLAAHWLLAALYNMHYSAGFMLLGGAFVLPLYGYLPLVYRLHKHERQHIVLYFSLIGAGFNLLLNMLLLPRMGITGAILSSALMQWGLLLLYWVEKQGAQINKPQSYREPV